MTPGISRSIAMSARTIAKKSKFFSKPVTGTANMFWSSSPEGLPILVTRCWVTNTAFTTMASVSAICIATSNGAGAVAHQRGENWSKSHGYCTLR